MPLSDRGDQPFPYCHIICCVSAYGLLPVHAGRDTNRAPAETICCREPYKQHLAFYLYIDTPTVESKSFQNMRSHPSTGFNTILQGGLTPTGFMDFFHPFKQYPNHLPLLLLPQRHPLDLAK